MDGVSALSLVAALIDISRFCFDFVQTAKEIHRAKDGLSRDLELESFTHKLTECITKIQSNPARSKDSILAALCSKMEPIAEELLHKLAKRRQPGGATLKKIWLIGKDELMRPKQLEELEEKLCGLFDTVQIRFVVLSYVFVVIFALHTPRSRRAGGTLTELKGPTSLSKKAMKLTPRSKSWELRYLKSMICSMRSPRRARPRETINTCQ
jgi:hypothetical protein